VIAKIKPVDPVTAARHDLGPRASRGSASPQRTRRLNRRGNRQLNHAIHIAAVTQLRHAHSDGRVYFNRKVAEGKTKKEALRSLKRRSLRRLGQSVSVTSSPTRTAPGVWTVAQTPKVALWWRASALKTSRSRSKPGCSRVTIVQRSHGAAGWTAAVPTRTARPHHASSAQRMALSFGSMALAEGIKLQDGLVAVVKRDCPTCATVVPVLAQLATEGAEPLTVYTQDDPTFPPGIDGVVYDRDLTVSWLLKVDTVPTLVRIRDGAETARTVGWDRGRWEELSGLKQLGPGLPPHRPGCGSRTTEPSVAEELDVRFRGPNLRSRRVVLSELEDEMEAMWDRGWSDGLPVVPPTEARVLAMLDGTTREPDEVVATVPPNLVPVTVEKVAINAVLAGCRPEYLPVVLAAVDAACTDEFNMHGLLATTWSAGPVVVVNGPVTRFIGMNSGVNVFGPGNRANATIGRALQLVIRNVGGGRPGQVDRAVFGTPGKYSFCFAEDQAGSPWEPMSVERGLPAETSAVTLFAGGGVRGIVDQQSRSPESLARSYALALGGVGFDAMLVVSPDHGRVFRDGGWTKARLRYELDELLARPGPELRSVGGIAEGIPEHLGDKRLPKYPESGLLLAYAGGRAGLFSAVIEGWVGGRRGSIPVTKEVVP